MYNLPETIRESDLEKLSFAVELSKAFFLPEDPVGSGAAHGSSAGSSGTADDAAGSTAGGDGGVRGGATGGDAGAGSGEVLPIQPGHMVWLIQRDFLQGKSLGQTLTDALQLVPNPHADPGIAQLNRIRC